MLLWGAMEANKEFALTSNQDASMAAKLTAQKKDALLPPGPYCSETALCVTVHNPSSNSGETVELPDEMLVTSGLCFLSRDASMRNPSSIRIGLA